jgi:uncharacterized membrane protein YphA (DoxX/SURF4 family)
MRSAKFVTVAISSVLMAGSALAQTSWSQNFPTPDPAPPSKRAQAEAKAKADAAAKAKAPAATPTSGRTQVTVISLCAPITLLIGLPTPATAAVKIGDTLLGTVPSCSFKSFPIQPGEHEFRITAYDIMLKTTWDLNLFPTKTPFPAGTTYIIARGSQTYEWRKVDKATADQAIKVIQDYHAKK